VIRCPIDAVGPAADDYEVGRRLSGHEVIWAEGPAALAFLVDRWGFLGPQVLPDGLGYHRPDLRVELTVWNHHREAGVDTHTSAGRPGTSPGAPT
jgi:hypothetical protein